MANKAAIVAAVGLGIGAIILVTRQVKAAPPPEEFPTVVDIMGARNLAELDSYYELINELLITGEIDMNAYGTLYSAYEARFYELWEGTE